MPYILTESAKRDIETLAAQLLMNFTGHKVNLAKVGAARVLLLAAQVLGGWTGVRVALNADASKEDGFSD